MVAGVLYFLMSTLVKYSTFSLSLFFHILNAFFLCSLLDFGFLLIYAFLIRYLYFDNPDEWCDIDHYFNEFL